MVVNRIRKTRSKRKSYQKNKHGYKKRNHGTKKMINIPNIEKMNCSPAVKGKSVNESSCLTPDILLKIKNKYNEDHPDTLILTKDPREIWKELNERLSAEGCKKEDCWLKELDDESLRNQIEKHIFAPDMPREWLTNPDEWLSNFDIFNVIAQYQETYPDFKLMGPTTMDFDTRLPEKNNQCVEEDICNFQLKSDIKKGFKKFACVVNLDKHWQSGSHWVSLYVDTDAKLIFYFDSAGCSRVPKEIEVLVNRIKEQGKQLHPSIDFTFYTNGNKNHQKGNTECGMYSIFFIITMLTGKTPFHKDRILSIQDRLDLFLKKRIPDEVVFDYRDLYFNKPDQ
jgi:hypothetical protein